MHHDLEVAVVDGLSARDRAVGAGVQEHPGDPQHHLGVADRPARLGLQPGPGRVPQLVLNDVERPLLLDLRRVDAAPGRVGRELALLTTAHVRRDLPRRPALGEGHPGRLGLGGGDQDERPHLGPAEPLLPERPLDLRELLEGPASREVLACGLGTDAMAELGVLDDALVAPLLVGAAVGHVCQVEGQRPGADVRGPAGKADPPVQLLDRQPAAQLQGDPGLDRLRVRPCDRTLDPSRPFGVCNHGSLPVWPIS